MPRSKLILIMAALSLSQKKICALALAVSFIYKTVQPTEKKILLHVLFCFHYFFCICSRPFLVFQGLLLSHIFRLKKPNPLLLLPKHGVLFHLKFEILNFWLIVKISHFLLFSYVKISQSTITQFTFTLTSFKLFLFFHVQCLNRYMRGHNLTMKFALDFHS